MSFESITVERIWTAINCMKTCYPHNIRSSYHIIARVCVHCIYARAVCATAELVQNSADTVFGERLNKYYIYEAVVVGGSRTISNCWYSPGEHAGRTTGGVAVDREGEGRG